MAARSKKRFFCTECGAEASKWSGQCADCGAWNTMVEAPAAAPNSRSGYAGAAGGAAVVSLDEVTADASKARLSTANSELDRVLGGGLIGGSVVLLGGDPGIGKSTLLLQVAAALGAGHKVLYVSGEESAQQIAQRGQRLAVDLKAIRCLTETSVEQILDAAVKEQPAVMIVDSVQTLHSGLVQSAPGSVAQVRESAAALVRHAKSAGVSIFLVGHVTKEGGIAGPRVLEHMVDTVLYFEGETSSRYRVIRSLKNRYGAASELGVFAMTETGLKPVANPSAIFLSGHPGQAPGSVIAVAWEGTRPLLMELQALVADSPMAQPRRLAVGLDGQRLGMQLAVLQRGLGIALGDQDVFVNAVGGLKVSETAADLPLLLAIYSSFRDRPPPPRLVAFGEVGLSGEIRPVPFGQERLNEAAKQGFKLALVPKENCPRRGGGFGELEVRGVGNLQE
ncbi:MAG: DNA repair protein RadA, partial [Pseudomonadota bacterium]